MLIQKKNYQNLDIAKFICSLLVVMIHTAPFEKSAPELNFFLVNVLARIAVPLFYIMSGFLLFGPMEYQNGTLCACKENHHRIFRYWKRIAVLYGGWALAYLLIVKIPMWINIGWWGPHVIKDAAAALLFSGMHYHLWYLLALLYAVPLLYVLQQFLKKGALLTAAGLFWLCECLRYSYSWVGIDQIPLLIWVSDRMPTVLDAAFRATPLMLLGAVVARSEERKRASALGILALIGFFLCTAEVYLLRGFTPNGQCFSYLIFTPFMAVFLLRYLVAAKQITIRPQVSSFLRNTSTIIYCLHPMLIELLGKYEISNGALWISTTLLSMLAAGMAVLARKYIIRN